MSKLIISLVGVLLIAFSHQAHAQLAVNIKYKGNADEGITLLRHGEFSYQVGIESGKVSHVYFGNKRMAEITGNTRTEKIEELIETPSELYEDLSCECLSLWQSEDVYTLFEVSDESARTDYTLHYHIIVE